MEVGDLKPAQVWKAQYRGLVRLLLFFTGQTHDLLNQMADEARMAIVREAGDDGELDGLGYLRAQRQLLDLWADTFKAWKRQFEILQAEAAAIAYGGLCALHENYVRPALEKTLHEATADNLFDRLLRSVAGAAQRRIYEDGLNLSARIWRLDHQSRAGLEQVLANGVANRKSAYAIAGDLEAYLGPGRDCPRWTTTRLGLTKTQIAAGDLRGLKSGGACRGQGVAYNALRLARNEYQIIHGMATDDVMQALPFVEQEQISLSPSHPERDRCDEVVTGGEGGRGIYPKGTIQLPIHVQCLCIKTAVLMKPAEFTDRLRAWRNGSQAWPAMDSYADYLGGDVGIGLGGTAVLETLLRWASGTVDEMQSTVQ